MAKRGQQKTDKATPAELRKARVGIRHLKGEPLGRAMRNEGLAKTTSVSPASKGYDARTVIEAAIRHDPNLTDKSPDALHDKALQTLSDILDDSGEVGSTRAMTAVKLIEITKQMKAEGIGGELADTHIVEYSFRLAKVAYGILLASLRMDDDRRARSLERLERRVITLGTELARRKAAKNPKVAKILAR